LGQLLRQHPADIASGWVHSLIPFGKNLVTIVTGASYLKLALLAALSAGLVLRNWRSLVSREGAACGVYAATFIVLLSPMAGDARYFLLGYTLFAAWLFTNIADLRWQAGTGVHRMVNRGCMVLAGIFIAVWLLPSAIGSAGVYRRPDNQELVPLMSAATRINQTISEGRPVVVGFHPYLYSLFTGAQALSIPQSDDEYLVSYMRKYHACCIALNEQELSFWRPQWRTALPPQVIAVASIDGYRVYRVAP
jgi:hypothetical protein